LTRKRYRQSSIKEIRLSSYLTETNKFYRDWTAKLKTQNPIVGDKIVLKSDDAEDEPAPETEKWIYPGKVYLLTAPRTYSSGFMLAETFKCYKLGTMLGESPGSHRNLTGELMRFTLPNSKLVGYVASSHFYPPCYQKAKTDFLEPDVKIEQTLEDLTAGKDTVLEYVKKLNAAKN
jgi:C-terminal processing protease CtpA/Prc